MPQRSTEEIRALANEDPEFTKIWHEYSPLFDGLDFDDPNILTILRSERPLPECPSDVKETTQTYETRDKHTLNLLVFGPAVETKNPSPLVVLYHGGGGTVGRPSSLSVLCRQIVQRFGAIVVAPQYRLAPEFPFPIGRLDSWDALKHIASNAISLGASPEHGFIIGGISAGSTYSGVLMLLARDEKLNPPLTGLYLSAGSVTSLEACPEKYRSRYLSKKQDECINAPVLNKAMKAFLDKSTNVDYSSPLSGSLQWPTGLAGLPPAYLQTCGMDVNRDESLVLQEALEESGVPTRLDIYPGLPHCFWAFAKKLNHTQKWERDTIEGFEWLLNQKP